MSGLITETVTCSIEMSDSGLTVKVSYRVDTGDPIQLLVSGESFTLSLDEAEWLGQALAYAVNEATG